MNSPLTHTPLSRLVEKLLTSVDRYNANDLTRTTVGSQGYMAALALNKALHTIYGLIRESKYLQAHPSTVFSSTANQAHIDLDLEPQLDEIESITDATNQIKLSKRTWSWYRRNFPSPANSTGTPKWYVRRWTRIYLAHTPQSVINYTVDFIKNTNDLVNDQDIPLIPTRFDFWIIAEARIEWSMMEDPQGIPAAYINERNEKRLIGMNSAMAEFDQVLVSDGHWGTPVLNRDFDFRRPVGS